jgi:hypothetical protein
LKTARTAVTSNFGIREGGGLPADAARVDWRLANMDDVERSGRPPDGFRAAPSASECRTAVKKA